MTVGVLTTCYTQYTTDSSICVYFFYLIEQHSKFCYVPYRCSICAELKVRIRTAIETITADMRNELDYRVDVCRITKGAHIGHL